MNQKTHEYFMTPISILGIGCLEQIITYIKPMAFRKALIVSDHFLVESNLIQKLTDLLENAGIFFIIYDQVSPNPTVDQVEYGLKLFQDNGCDFLISFGGGSPHDCAKAIALIMNYLPLAVKNGSDIKGREMMVYAEYLAGIAFNNASLGYVHAMAHQLGGMYNLPHGLANVLLLPAVCEFNLHSVPQKYADITKVMGIDTRGLSLEQSGKLGISAIKNLIKELAIPQSLTNVRGFAIEDIPTLASNALQDGCAATNPRQGTQQDLESIFTKIL